ncbi:hypothetical protein [Pseudomonas moraviensis]|uniref:Putative delta-60 repeat protein n=1 Tax=Pseudomonas moraviensis TaxID=321662 RepID=A0A7Y9VS20_9PSED|nr:hypothetical protein [Pseudomonas moraviensis]NYH07422.1 putative delta-60 repeat protein [Pseudomonas moraviensis]
MMNSRANRGDFDENFGDGGRVQLRDEAGVALEVERVLILPSGSILCAAYSSASATIYLAKLDPNGNLDSRFGVAGLAKFKLSDQFPGMKSARPFDLKFNEVGQHIVMGFRAVASNGTLLPGLAKFKAEGVLDSSFGTQGVTCFNYLELLQGSDSSLPSSSSSPTEELELSGALVTLDDGSVMLASSQPYEDLYNYAVLAKVAPDGSLDKGFHQVGFLLLRRNGRHLMRIESLVQQESKFLLAATTQVSEEGGWFLQRLDAEGNVDVSFGNNGYYDQQPKVKKSILFRRDLSQIFLIGTSANLASQHLFLVTQRRGADGQFDPLYGDQGWTGVLEGNGDIKVFGAQLYNPGSTIVVAAGKFNSQGIGDAVIGTVEQGMGWQGSFGKEGLVVLTGKNIVHSLAIQSDRNIVIAASNAGSPATHEIFRLIG